jgi:hypothetical protein
MESLFCSVAKYILGKYFENIFLVLGKYILGKYFSNLKNNDFMLEKNIVPCFGKLLIVGRLKGLYGSTVGCCTIAFVAKGKRVISCCF